MKVERGKWRRAIGNRKKIMIQSNGNKMRTWQITVIIILLLCGGGLRFVNLDGQSLWVDEVNVAFAADNWANGGDFSLPSGYVYTRAPIYTVFSGLLIRLFGNSETTARFPAALFGLLSCGMAFILARRIFGVRVALLTLFFMAFSHFEVGWSRTARMYSLLQLSALILAYAFLRGFEAKQNHQKNQTLLHEMGFFQTINQRFRLWGISPVWLIFLVVLLIYGWLQIHQLMIFMAGVVVLYMLTRGIQSVSSPSKILNKFLIVSVPAVLFMVFMIAFVPFFRGAASFFLSYTPSWASGTSSAQNPMVLFEFLLSMQRFPLAAFFFIGAVQVITRKHDQGWLPIWGLVFPLLLLSFVFTHRVPTYLFYVYPFFLILAAYGFVNILNYEIRLFEEHKWKKSLVVVLFLSIFVISPWLRMTLHIPNQQDGITNMAVTPDEWREASDYILQNKDADDLIITGLPQVPLYYGLISDYSLNWASLRQSIDENFVNSEGINVDVYAGVECIHSLDQLKHIINTNPSGYFAISKYSLDHELYIPVDVRNYILSTFNNPIETRNGTVFIYTWHARKEHDGF